MQDLKITLIQANQHWEDKITNLEHFENLLTSVEQTDLILFPEMFHTGFTMNSVVLAENMESSLGIAWLQKIASNKNAACYTSLIIEESGHYYNRGVFIFPTGEILHYDKRKLFGLANENEHFTSGDDEVIVEYKGWRINLQICYDLRFPENCRNFEKEDRPNYDLLLYVANWPERRITHWQTLLPARAIENQCFVAAVNRVGKDENQNSYTGESGIYNPIGEKISNLSNQECIIEEIMSAEQLLTWRTSLPFLKDANLKN